MKPATATLSGRVARVLMKPVRALATRAAMAVAESETIQGMRVTDMTLDHSGRPLAPSVQAALALIQQYDPDRLAGMKHDVRAILIVRTHGSAGEFWAHVRAVVLDVDHLRTHQTASVAMTIVHEATHARLHREGLVYEEDRGGIERRCVDEEIRFAARVPGAEHLIVGARRKLETQWWDGSSGRRQFSRRLKALGAPLWLRKALLGVLSD